MKKYKVKNGPFLKDKNTTLKIMIHLIFSLIPIILFSFYKNGIIPFINNEVDVVGLFYPLIFILISTFTSFFVEFIYYKITHNNTKELLFISIFPGLFLGLILPLNTPISMLIFGSICAVVIGKLFFGGFGKNIFNPALIGNLFILVILIINNNYTNFYNIDIINYISFFNKIDAYKIVIESYGNLIDFFIESGLINALLCFSSFIYLILTKSIKWRIPICYILTVFLMTFIIGKFNSLGIWYSLFQIINGELFFGSIFMATDPVTSPTTKYGQVLYGIGLGLLTVMFRCLTLYQEDVLTSILLMNMLVFIIDKFGAKARFNMKKYIFIPIGLIIFSILISFYIGIEIPNNIDNFNEFEYNKKSKD